MWVRKGMGETWVLDTVLGCPKLLNKALGIVPLSYGQMSTWVYAVHLPTHTQPSLAYCPAQSLA